MAPLALSPVYPPLISFHALASQYPSPMSPVLPFRRRLVSLAVAAASVRQDSFTWTLAPLSLVRAASADSSLFHISVDVSDSPDLVSAHTTAGQYLQLRLPSAAHAKPTFLAIASPPSLSAARGEFEFLVKRVEGSTAELLSCLKSGDVVEMSGVMGRGFEIDRISSPDVAQTILIFATGSGISPIRSLIESDFSAIERPDVRLYYGARNLQRMAYQDRFKKWESLGVKIVPVLSRPDDSWEGERGYVQAVFSRAKQILDASSTAAVLCGHKAMTEMGASCALDTLCGQSFGAKKYKLVGIYLQRAMVVVFLVSIPLAIVTALSGRVLILLKQVPEISESAEAFSQLMIPSIFAYGLLQCILRYLQAQKIVIPIMLSTAVSALFHFFNTWFFTNKTGLGYRGAALSVSISYWLNLLLLIGYIRNSISCESTWTGFSPEAFHKLWSFLRLGIPSTLMVCFQNWQFELLLLLSGLLENPELQTAVMSISQNISSLAYVIPVGISGAISTRISNELGAENPKAAKLAVLTAALTCIIEGLIVGLAMIGGRNFWGNAYSSERKVVNAVAEMMPWIALSHCIDGFQCVLLGTVRGCGRQKIGAFVCLCSYYIIGIPASIILGFVYNMGVKGLWIGNICAIIVQDLVLLLMSTFTNWDKQVEKAKQRVDSSVLPIAIEGTENPKKIAV